MLRSQLKHLVLGTEELCERLVEAGIDASIIPEDSDKRVQKGWLKSDLGYIETPGWDVDVVALRVEGGLSPHPRNWSTTVKAGSLPLLTSKVMPVQYHFVISFHQLGQAADFKATLQKPGGFLRRRTKSGWQGGRLAERLTNDTELTAGVAAELGADDNLWVRADFRDGCIRIVLKSRLAFRFAMLPTPTAELERGLPSTALLKDIGGVAQHVRALM